MSEPMSPAAERAESSTAAGVEVLLLGVAQDGGFPQFGCQCRQCARVFLGELEGDSAVSLAGECVNALNYMSEGCMSEYLCHV